MIQNEVEYQAMLERIEFFQQQLLLLRKVETNPVNYRLSAGGFLAELDRMYREVRLFLWQHPSEIAMPVA